MATTAGRRPDTLSSCARSSCAAGAPETPEGDRNVSGARVVQNLCLSFMGVDKPLLKLDYWQFE